VPASFTLTGTGEYYPSGTSVAVYPRAAMVQGQAPSGSSVASAVSGSSSVVFSGLEYSTQYTAYALLGGVHRYKTFRTDDAPNVVVGPQGPPGVDGTNGTNGAGALSVDVWASQANPAAVTDWGPIVNALIVGGARLLGFGAHIFPFSTKITNQAKQNVIFQGAGGWLHPWYRSQGGGPDRPVTQLVWKGGASSGTAMEFDHDGHILRDLAVLYDTGAYDGTLVKFASAANQAARCAVERCYIGSLGNGTGFTTATGVDVSSAVGIRIVQSVFNGLKCGYFCRSGALLSDDMIMDGVTFQCCSEAFIKNLPRSGSFKNLVFYGQAFTGTGTQPDNFILGDSSNTLASPSEVSIQDVWCWDQQTPSTGQFVRLLNQPANQDWRINLKNVFSFGKQVIWLNGPGAIDMDNVSAGGTAWLSTDTANAVDLGNSATALKKFVRIKNLRGAWNLDAPAPIVNIAGHANVNIASATVYPGVRTLSGHERVIYDNPNTTANNHAYPTIVANAAGTHVSLVGIAGTDAAGWVEIYIDGTGQAARRSDLPTGWCSCEHAGADGCGPGERGRRRAGGSGAPGDLHGGSAGAFQGE
jgi:hypothetical protein